MTDPDESTLFGGPFFWFVRHGESQANRDGTIAGTLDSPLSERGRRQALRAARLLAACPPACIWTGKLRRVRETAAVIGGILGIAPREDAEDWERCRNTTLTALQSLRGPRLMIIVGHSGNYRVLTELLLHIATDDPIPNAVPVMFESSGDLWRLKSPPPTRNCGRLQECP